MTTRHLKEDLRAFLDADLRQVWALHRTTGEPRFLPDGEAERWKDEARTNWRCPMPGCDVEIIAVNNGTRRDHFRHRVATPHSSDGEGEAHLASKGMLAQWARAIAPGANVKEEQTVKDAVTSLHRVADVMVTWSGTRTRAVDPTHAIAPGHAESETTRVAFEVEYKNFTISDWRRKHDDYISQDITAVWLVGHTRVTMTGDPQQVDGRWVTPVRVGGWAPHLGGTGGHVFVINPITQQVGTVAGDAEFTRRLTDLYGHGWLAVHPLHACNLEPAQGFTTPASRYLDATIARLEARENHALTRLREATAKRHRESLFAKERWEKIDAANQEAWVASPLRQQILDRWGSIPSLIHQPNHDTYGIHAHPAHWHAALHEAHLHGQPARHTFTVDDCWDALARHGIQQNRSTSRALKSLAAHLKALEDAGLITIHRSDNQITHLTTLGVTLPEAEKAAIARAVAKQKAREAAARAKQHDANEERARAEQTWAEQQERRRRTERVRAAQHQRWVTSGIYRTVLDTFNGNIPKPIGWPGGASLDAIDAAPAHWRAHIYMTHIHGHPPGTAVDAGTARHTLIAHDIKLLAQRATVLDAIDDYLHNLLQRGILSRPRDNHVGGESSGYITVHTTANVIDASLQACSTVPTTDADHNLDVNDRLW